MTTPSGSRLRDLLNGTEGQTTTTPTATTEELSPRLRASGVFLFRRFLNSDLYQRVHNVPRLDQILEGARLVQRKAPLFIPRMFDGKPFRYQMTNCGNLGWLASPDAAECVTDVKEGYYYSGINPYTGEPWPEMPEAIRRASQIAASLSGWKNFRPETCLINYYRNIRETLGIHRDITEENKSAPVVSLSIGDTGIFQIGGATKAVPLETIRLKSGDCVVLAGDSRLFYHKFEQLIPNSSRDLPSGGRLNLTIRQVNN